MLIDSFLVILADGTRFRLHAVQLTLIQKFKCNVHLYLLSSRLHFSLPVHYCFCSEIFHTCDSIWVDSYKKNLNPAHFQTTLKNVFFIFYVPCLISTLAVEALHYLLPCQYMFSFVITPKLYSAINFTQVRLKSSCADQDPPMVLERIIFIF